MATVECKIMTVLSVNVSPRKEPAGYRVGHAVLCSCYQAVTPSKSGEEVRVRRAQCLSMAVCCIRSGVVYSSVV